MNLIETLQQVFEEKPLCRSLVFDHIWLFNKDKMNMIGFTSYVFLCFEQASFGTLKIDHYETPYFELMKNNYNNPRVFCTDLEFLQNAYPDITFSQSINDNTKIAFSKISWEEN
jgi:hypothetical protein